jgi:hypothetical protein
MLGAVHFGSWLLGCLVGVLAVEVLRWMFSFMGIFWRATRDTMKHWRLPLSDGYRWWSWLWLTPVIWLEMLRLQLRAWWGGYETEVFPQFI